MIELEQKGNKDAFVYYADRGYLAIQGFLVRRGTILNKEFRLKALYGEAEEEFISFLLQYYDTHPKATELVLPQDVYITSLEEVLDTNIFQPQKGYRKKLLDMCYENAKKQLDQSFNIVEQQDEKTEEAILKLEELAKHPMRRVELFDNSHTSGVFAVASCVVYEDGYPSKKDYRLYRLHTSNSDVDSMKEVLYRRYFRILKDEERMPDGIIVDGGLTQVNAANEIIDSLGITSIKIMGLVKDDHHNTNALMDTDGSIISIDKDSSLFFLLTRMQDEVHRVAISYHRKLRKKSQTKSILDEIEGVGVKRKNKLLRTFKNFTNLKNASVEEISEVVPYEVAQKVYDALHNGE